MGAGGDEPDGADLDAAGTAGAARGVDDGALAQRRLVDDAERLLEAALGGEGRGLALGLCENREVGPGQAAQVDVLPRPLPEPEALPPHQAADLLRVPAEGLHRHAVEGDRVGGGAEQAHAPQVGLRVGAHGGHVGQRQGRARQPAQVGDGGVQGVVIAQQLEQLGVACTDHGVEHVLDGAAPDEGRVEDRVGQVDHHVGIQYGAAEQVLTGGRDAARHGAPAGLGKADELGAGPLGQQVEPHLVGGAAGFCAGTASPRRGGSGARHSREPCLSPSRSGPGGTPSGFRGRASGRGEGRA